MRTIALRFLDPKPRVRTGVTWGVSLPAGELRAADAVHLQRADYGALPTQTWPLAFWPDGSVKWLGCAAVVGPEDGEVLTLAPGPGPSPARTSTNCAAQWCLNAIELLALVPEALDASTTIP